MSFYKTHPLYVYTFSKSTFTQSGWQSQAKHTSKQTPPFINTENLSDENKYLSRPLSLKAMCHIDRFEVPQYVL